MTKKYAVRCSCANCGFEGFYTVPIGYVLNPFEPPDGSFEDPTYSTYESVDDDHKEFLVCSNCAQPYLIQMFWSHGDNRKRVKKA